MLKSGWTFLAVLTTASLVLATQPGQPTLPEGHPPTDPPGGEEPAEVIPADPADVESLDAIVNAYFSAISGAKGEPRDWDRLRSLFKPMSRMIAARPTREGGAGLWALKPDDFIGFNKKYFENGGYFESEVARRVESFGNIAHVWVTYESRRDKREHIPYARGIYSMQLLRDGERWWIVNAYWDYERPEDPIPQKYLENQPETP